MAKINEIVSIIIPIYNGEMHIDSCLNSLLHQSYSSIEIILINDGSNDLTGNKCREWADKDKRIRYFEQKNMGVGAARNLGIMNSSGDYIAFVDIDDTCKSGLIEELVSIMQRDKCDAVFCGYDRCYIEKETIYSQFGDELTKENIKKAGVQLAARKYDCGVWAKLFKKNIIINDVQNILFNNEFQIGEDYVWLMSVLKNCAHISSTAKCLYNYNIRKGSASHSFVLDKRNMSHLKALEYCLSMEWVDEVGCKEDLEYRLFTQIHIFKLVAILENNQKCMDYIDAIMQRHKNLKKKWYCNRNVPLISKIKDCMMNVVFYSPLSNRIALYVYNFGRKEKLIVDCNSR